MYIEEFRNVTILMLMCYLRISGHVLEGFIIIFLLTLMQVDMVTPMCSQLTYEGLLDEVKACTLGL